MEVYYLNIIEVANLKKDDIRFYVEDKDVIKVLTFVNDLDIDIEINIKRKCENISKIVLRVSKKETNNIVNALSYNPSDMTLEKYINKNIEEDESSIYYNESFCNLVLEYLGSYEIFSKEDEIYLNNKGYSKDDFIEDEDYI